MWTTVVLSDSCHVTRNKSSLIALTIMTTVSELPKLPSGFMPVYVRDVSDAKYSWTRNALKSTKYRWPTAGNCVDIDVTFAKNAVVKQSGVRIDHRQQHAVI